MRSVNLQAEHGEAARCEKFFSCLHAIMIKRPGVDARVQASASSNGRMAARTRLLFQLDSHTQTGAIMDLVFSSTTQLATAIRAGHVSASEVLEAHLAQIDKHNAALNAVITLDAGRAYERAREADAALARGEVWGPLHGVPFTL